MSQSFEVISGKTVKQVISANHSSLVDKTAAAYLAHHHQNAVNPVSHFLRFPKNPDARIIALPAHFDAPMNVSGLKWISSFPSNLDRGIPRASAVMILNDYETGYPFACLEASVVSAARTAASAVLAAYHLNGKSKKTKRIGVIGTGLIARYIVEFFVGNDWDIDQICVFDLSEAYAGKFRDRINKDHGIDVVVETSADAIIRQSDIVVFATTAAKPYVTDFAAFENNPIVLHISLRDIDPDILLQSHNVVDDIDHCLKAQTSPHMASEKVGHHEFINTTLPKILAGDEAPGRDKPIIFSPFGMGILDLAFSHYIYEKASADQQTQPIDGFFHEMTRI
jgi:2,3-diaminopropionate biosynthesis protein SbnB